MQGLGLERYTAVFEEQEIDLTVVHAISSEELAGLGVTDRLHQVRSGAWGALLGLPGIWQLFQSHHGLHQVPLGGEFHCCVLQHHNHGGCGIVPVAALPGCGTGCVALCTAGTDTASGGCCGKHPGAAAPAWNDQWQG